MKTGFKVCDAMTKMPVTVPPETSLEKCAQTMASEHVGALLIKDNSRVVGVITEQDIVRKAVAKALDPKKSRVKEIMEAKLITISPEKDIFEALIKMRDHNIRHLPVLDKGKFIGLLTLKDVLKIEPQLFDLLVEKFELREEQNKPIYRFNEEEGICQSCGEYAEHLYNVDGAMLCIKCKREQSG